MTNLNTLESVEIESAPFSCLATPPHRILVVEDDADNRRLNAEALLRAGYEVDVAEDGTAAWKALNTDTYDLMITDHQMPRLTGVELLKKVYAARMALAVIMATGTCSSQEVAPSPWLRPDALLLKPYTAAELLRAVKRVLHATDVACKPIVPLPG